MGPAAGLWKPSGAGRRVKDGLRWSGAHHAVIETVGKARRVLARRKPGKSALLLRVLQDCAEDTPEGIGSRAQRNG